MYSITNLGQSPPPPPGYTYDANGQLVPIKPPNKFNPLSCMAILQATPPPGYTYNDDCQLVPIGTDTGVSIPIQPPPPVEYTYDEKGNLIPLPLSDLSPMPTIRPTPTVWGSPETVETVAVSSPPVMTTTQVPIIANDNKWLWIGGGLLLFFSLRR